MGKLTLIFFIFIFKYPSYAIDSNNLFQNDVQLLDEIRHKKKLNINTLKPNLHFSKYKKDPKKRIKNTFKVDPYYLERVSFWFSIYTIYDSNHSVLHDKKNMNLIYDVLDFSGLRKSKLSNHTKFAIQNRIVKEKVKQYKKAFFILANGKKRNAIAKRIFQSIKKSKLKIPKNKRKMKRFYKSLSAGFRAQTGQKNNIAQGLKNLTRYEKTIKNYFEVFNLPYELIAVPFLESSFNIHARSKVGATGPWQFMRRVGRHFMSVDKWSDHRRNTLISTISALHLLAQNKKILKHWDLAVSAYNNGVGNLLKGIRSLKKRGFKNPKLKNLLKSYKNKNLGFASQNFYSEFIALVYTLAYREDFFSHIKNPSKQVLHTYVTKCKLKPNWFIKKLKKSVPYIKELNNHFRKSKLKKLHPKGTIVISPTELTSRRYLKIAPKKMRRKYPINWKKLVKNQSCSTK